MEIKYLRKSAKLFADGLNYNYEKPSTCPHCGYGTDATIEQKTLHNFNGHYLLLATCKCTSCQKSFFFASEKKDDEDFAKCVCMTPSISATEYKNDILSSISERFIFVYNQALRAEFNEDFELGAVGFRSALEILIKDYAINELHLPKEDVIHKDLFKSIAEYLHRDELINTADVIRILGNDYTHYERKYPEHDFHLLKGYMDIFLKQIEVAYMVNNPPVSRTP